MEYLASMYIDDEMNLEEKKEFVQKISSDPGFCTFTMDLLKQETLLIEQCVIPETISFEQTSPPFWKAFRSFLRPAGFLAAGFSSAMLLFFTVFYSSYAPLPKKRFIFFEPGVEYVEIMGSFTDWQRIPMKQIGQSGYWELTLEVDIGEHRFAYILNGERRIVDPTIQDREMDDFGGENSILKIEERT